MDHLVDTMQASHRDERASFSGGLSAEESEISLRNLDESETDGRVGPNGLGRLVLQLLSRNFVVVDAADDDDVVDVDEDVVKAPRDPVHEALEGLSDAF